MAERGDKDWFFITADYAFGHQLEDDATAVVKASGGRVVGSVHTPLNTPDFSSYLLQAQNSHARVVALAMAVISRLGLRCGPANFRAPLL